MYWVVTCVGLVYVLGAIMSGTRVCIGWYHEWDSCMYWVVLSGTRVCIECYHEWDSCMYWVLS
jgi:hypothetical protein